MFPHTYFPPAMWLENGAPTGASETFVANIGLQKLGAASIVSMSDDSREARAMNSCYSLMRDRELRAAVWNFSVHREILAPSITVPEFGFNHAFLLPNGLLRILPPPQDVDWTIENIDSVPHLLTNDGEVLNLRFVKRVTDATIFDVLFIEMLACKLAWHLCELITQSNTKKADLKEEYKDLRNEARRINAFEKPSPQEPIDPWLISRRTGTEMNWLRGGW